MCIRDWPEPTEAVPGRPVSGSGEALRLIARDDGELIVRTLVPEVIHAGIAIHGHLEITTKLGARFSAKQVVITVEDPHHLSLIHISEPTRLLSISYAVFCLKKKKTNTKR